MANPTYSLWKNGSPTLAFQDEPSYSEQYLMTAWDFTDQSVLVYGVRLYAGGSMVGRTAELGIILPPVNPTLSPGGSISFTVSKQATLTSGWNTVLFDNPIPLSGNTRIEAVCHVGGGAYYYVTGLATSAQTVPGMTSVSLSPTVANGKVPTGRGVYYGYDSLFPIWDQGVTVTAFALEPIVGKALVVGPGRAFPLNGLPVGTTAGTVAAGNDSRFPHVDSYNLQRPRVERLDLYVLGNLVVKTEMLKRTIFGTGVIRRVSAQAGAVGSGASASVSILLNAASIAGFSITSASATSSTSSMPVSDADTISLSITAVSGTIDGLNVSVWVEYP